MKRSFTKCFYSRVSEGLSAFCKCRRFRGKRNVLEQNISRMSVMMTMLSRVAISLCTCYARLQKGTCCAGRMKWATL